MSVALRSRFAAGHAETNASIGALKSTAIRFTCRCTPAYIFFSNREESYLQRDSRTIARTSSNQTPCDRPRRLVSPRPRLLSSVPRLEQGSLDPCDSHSRLSVRINGGHLFARTPYALRAASSSSWRKDQDSFEEEDAIGGRPTNLLQTFHAGPINVQHRALVDNKLRLPPPVRPSFRRETENVRRTVLDVETRKSCPRSIVERAVRRSRVGARL